VKSTWVVKNVALVMRLSPISAMKASVTASSVPPTQ